MRVRRLLVPLVLPFVVMASAPPATAAVCRAGEDPATGQYQAATGPLYGLADSRWTVSPAGGVPGPAFSVRPVSGFYRTPFAGETWIASSGLGTGTSDPAAPIGVYTYQTTITFPPAATYVSLALAYAVDNDVVWRINGTVVDSWDATGNDASGYAQFHGFAIDNNWPLVNGVNTLTAEVTNRGLWEGLYVFGGSLYCV